MLVSTWLKAVTLPEAAQQGDGRAMQFVLNIKP